MRSTPFASDSSTNNGIAVIGLAGRFPGADSADEFWMKLVAGISGVTDVEIGNRRSSLPSHPNYVAKTAVVKNGDCFDAKFFGIYPKQAIDLDPQHRLFLEMCWHAMEDAGYVPDNAPGRVGVFAGCHMNTYIFTRMAADPEFRSTLADCFPGGGLNAEISNDKDYLATRVAYHLNFKGPSVAIQSACSTSLVAIAQACESLSSGSCDMAIAGGVTVTFPQEQGYLHTEDSILSPDGTCRTFDADAKGTIFGDGVGVVVLKRVAEAMADRDDIYAVISGWGVNNDGGDKNGYTAPSVSGQSTAIRLAHKRAGITADKITYVEAHGTGTLVGDPIEVQALTEAFRDTTDRKQFCRLGSLKTNVGHLDVAAGVASVIKTCFSLKKRILPPILNFRSPNPRIDFENSPFIVNTTLTPWETETLPRRAGVSSFGVGGTNAHVIMEESPEIMASAPLRTRHIVRLSAQSQKALDEMAEDLASYLESHPESDLADVSYTLMTGRKTFRFKKSIIASSANEAAELLRQNGAKQIINSNVRAADVPIIMMFPGQGSQHVNMAIELYSSEPVFKEAMDACANVLFPHLGVDLRDLVFADIGDSSRLDQTEIAQPALFTISFSLGRWWQSMGVKPSMLIGHSVGEFAAAALAGVMSLPDAARLVALRGRLMQALPAGGMLSISMSEQKLASVLPPTLEIAAVNGPEFCVVSGSIEDIESFAIELESGKHGDDVAVRRLRTSHAFHSRMMDPAIEPFEQVVREIQLSTPEIPIVSTVTSEILNESTAKSPGYWSRQIREPVRFSGSIAKILNQNQGGCILLEVGPNQALSTLARQQSFDATRCFVVPSLPQAKQIGSDALFITNALAQLWHCGANVNWNDLYRHEHRRRVHLPTYRFQRERYSFNTDTQNNPNSKSEETKPNAIITESIATTQASNQDRFNETSATVDSGLTPSSLVMQQMELMRQQIALLRKMKTN